MPGEHDGRRTQASRRATTQAALLRATSDVIVELGVGAVTLARVGEQAGYSRGIVTHYYGTKRALLEAVALSAQNGVAAVLQGEPPGLDRLLHLVQAYLGNLGEDGPRWSAFVLLWAQAASDRDLSVIMQARDSYFRGYVSEDVAAGVTSGHILPGTDPDAVAVALIGQLRGISLQLRLDPSAVDLLTLRHQVPEHWRRALSS